MMNSFRTLVLQLRTFTPCAAERLRTLRKLLPYVTTGDTICFWIPALSNPANCCGGTGLLK